MLIGIIILRNGTNANHNRWQPAAEESACLVENLFRELSRMTEHSVIGDHNKHAHIIFREGDVRTRFSCRQHLAI